MKDYTSKFADALIVHVLSQKKHYRMMSIISGAFLAPSVIFAIFLLSPAPILGESLFGDLPQMQESLENDDTRARYDITPLVMSLVILPFALSLYILYFGVREARHYDKWRQKIQNYEKQRKIRNDLGDELE